MAKSVAPVLNFAKSPADQGSLRSGVNGCGRYSLPPAVELIRYVRFENPLAGRRANQTRYLVGILILRCSNDKYNYENGKPYDTEHYSSSCHPLAALTRCLDLFASNESKNYCQNRSNPPQTNDAQHHRGNCESVVASIRS